MEIDVDERITALDVLNGDHRTLVDVITQTFDINGCNVLAMVGKRYRILEEWP